MWNYLRCLIVPGRKSVQRPHLGAENRKVSMFELSVRENAPETEQDILFCV